MKAFADTWFFNKGWTPYPFQQRTWEALAQGQSGLLNAPTGYGKTYALWFGILEHYFAHRSYQNSKGLHAIWVSPLRALATEIQLATQAISNDLELDYRVETRTGDTPVSAKQKQKKNAPQAFITTPESIHLLLASKGYVDYFRNLDIIVVDEWHELLGSKRGVLIELAISRLKAINPTLIVWGISATIGNLPEAKKILLGNRPKSILVREELQKKIEVQTILPDELDTLPWAGHLGIRMAEKVLPIIAAHNCTLLFTNTRSQAEIWYRALLDKAPGLSGCIAMHHGSLGMDTRKWVEENLHSGTLKAVVCTSSLDLGVDFRPVDCVIQIGSPKGVARFMQRAGRSGHQPGATSKIYFLPTHSLEIMEGAALKYAVQKQMYEQRQPYIRSFDVLLQYMVTLAVSDGFSAKQLYREVKKTHCFQSLSWEEFSECLLHITQGGASLHSYEEFHKVEIDKGIYKVNDRRIAMQHRLSIGTIVSDAMVQVKYRKGNYLGSIEEWFISRLAPGEAFWFNGRLMELVGIRDMQAIVKPSGKKKGMVPSWKGGRFAISTDFSTALRHTFKTVNAKKQPGNTSPELAFLQPLFGKQRSVSAIPGENELLVEYIPTKMGFHLFVFPFEGKLVHEGMSAVIAFRLSRIRNASFSIASNEYGFELLSDTSFDIPSAIENGLFGSKGLMEDIQNGINVTEMARRKFRDIASIAGLVFPGYPGRPVKSKHLQASSGLFFSVFQEYDPDNLLLKEAFDEVYDFQLEYARMQQVFERIETNHIVLKMPAKLTPFAFPVFAESFRERYSNEDWQSRLEKLKSQLE